MKLHIKRCNNSSLWYWGKDGQTFEYLHTVPNKRYSHEKAAWEDVKAFIVRDDKGIANIVNKEDALLHLDSGVRVQLK